MTDEITVTCEACDDTFTVAEEATRVETTFYCSEACRRSAAHESMVYSVYLDGDPAEGNATNIADALLAAGFNVHAVRRLDTLGINALNDGDEDPERVPR